MGRSVQLGVLHGKLWLAWLRAASCQKALCETPAIRIKVCYSRHIGVGELLFSVHGLAAPFSLK